MAIGIDGKLLREYRDQTGMTQGELAASLGCSQGTVSQWEREGVPRSARLYDKIEGALRGSVVLPGQGADRRKRSASASPAASAASAKPSKRRTKKGGKTSGAKCWHALVRGDSRRIEDVVAAWLDEESALEELDRYLEWDRRAAETSNWQFIRFARAPRDNHYRAKSRANDPDLIEYHWVMYDMADGPITVLKNLP